MKRTFLDIVLVTIWCCLTPFCQLLGQIEKVDPEIRQLYEHYTGNSLEQVINNLDKSQQSSLNLNGNVVVRFNGGRPDQNKLFIGQKNTLEILVANDAIIGGLTLGLKFECASTQFSMVQNYGEKPTFGTGPLRVLKMHPEPFGTDPTWECLANTKASNDSILIGGLIKEGVGWLPSQTSPRLLYSLQIELPATATPVSSGFAVRSIFYPPAGSWTFTEQINNVAYSPHFQGNPNPDGANPTAPAVYFDIVEPPCYAPSQSPAIKPLPLKLDSNALGIQEIENHRSVIIRSNGEKLLNVWLEYDGDINVLSSLGVHTRKTRRPTGTISATFPMTVLPEVAMSPIVKRIYPGEPAGINLNHTTEMIHGNFRQIQPTYGVNGAGVIVGIIDSGFDWLHEDFRKSNGNTRVKLMWDQTNQCGTPPEDYDYGCQWDSTLIDQEISQLPPVPSTDTTGHGTRVAGAACGNGLGSSDTLFAGLAPLADLIVVRVELASDSKIDAAFSYIASKAVELGKPWVINCSIGKQYDGPTSRDGSHGWENTIDEIAEDTECGQGRIFVVASGNEGAKRYHARAFGSTEVELDISVDNDVTSAKDSLDICILIPNSSGDVSVTLVAPPYDLSSTYGPITSSCTTGPGEGWIADFDPTSTDGLVRIFNNTFSVSTMKDPINTHPNDNVVRFQVRDFVSPIFPYFKLPMRAGVWRLRLEGHNLGYWDAYVIGTDNSPNLKRFTENSASREYTISTPATAHNCIAVGSINTDRETWVDLNGITRYVNQTDYPAYAISEYTSMGPTRDGRASKPEVFAPGYAVMSARASNISDVSSPGYSGYLQGRYIAQGGKYVITAGTSMAAPHVTGAIALALQRDPTLSLSSLVDKLSQSSAGGTIDVTQFLGLISSGVVSQDSVASGQNSDDIILPSEFTLGQNHPNPFNNDTIIEFYLPRAVKSQDGLNLVRVEVFNVLGQLVRVLFEGICTPGTHRIAWDGKADNGANVASGVYLYRASTTDQVINRKMVILK